jgi:ATP-dependent helicase/DNAse subunit B
MRLLTGPPGSGKTSYILERFREQLDGSARLLVPTATMAQHLQNQLAREGRVFRRSLVQTFSGFVREWAGEATEVSRPVLYLLTEEAARRVNHPDFARVLDLAGFSASLARTIEELASAGCDSARLAGCLPPAPLAEAFLAVYREVDRELARRGLALRARRLETAAARIASEGLRGIPTVWLDGFHALPDPELAVIDALGRHAEVTLALGDEDLTEALRARLRTMGFHEERPGGGRAHPMRQLFKAPGIERETEEIARRILEMAAAGRPFREIAIVVRSAEPYVPVLRGTLERFGIPARFYFEAGLERHPATRYLTGAVDAMLAGWDHAATLSVLRLAPRFADFVAMDRFDFDVRERIPGAGLSGLHALLLDKEGQLRPGADRVAHKLDSLAGIEEWRGYSLRPKDWAARFRTLRNLFRHARPAATATHEMALAWRSQSAALDAFDEALDEAALAMPPDQEIAIDPWWRTVKSVLRLKPLRIEDGRRNVVHVLSAEEARQWSLPVVLLCGMVEKQFPRFHAQDPFFPDAARCRLNEHGIRVRTAAEFEREEHALFASALTRATFSVTLSYPEFDARGESSLPSIYLEGLHLEPADVRPVRPAPRAPVGPAMPPAIHDPALLEVLKRKTDKLTPTSLESFLQCPFQHFARSTLRLRGAPDRPQDRLSFLEQGNIVHEVLAEWWKHPQDIAGLFERIVARRLEDKNIPFGYHTERLRNRMIDDLTRFAAETSWHRGVFTSRTEEPFQLPLGDFLISGKIDRLDTGPGGEAYVFDYKYSAVQSVKAKLTNANLLQAPLYLMAAEEFFHLRPAGMFYIGVKGDVVYAGWSITPLLDSEALPENWLADTKARTLGIVQDIRGGRIDVCPSDTDLCRFCDFRDACRVDTRAAVERAEGA